MRLRHCKRTAKILAAAATAATFTLPLFVESFARGQTYSTTPVTVYAPASGTLTLGLNSTTNTDQGVINRDSSTVAGYITANSLKQIYFLSPTSPFPDTPSLISLTDSGHVQSASTPSLIEVSSSGEVLGNQTRLGSDGSTQLGTDVFTSTGTGSATVIPLPTTVLGSSPAAYYYTNTTVSQPEYTMSNFADTISNSGFNSEAIGTGGIVAGTVTRYAGDAEAGVGFLGASTPLGNDGFYYNPTTNTTTAIGLTGGANTYAANSAYGLGSAYMVQSNAVTGTAGANVAGYANRYTSNGATSLGNDGWIYTPANNTTTQIGLVGGIYTATDSNGNVYENTQTVRTNSAGQIAGKSLLLPTYNTTGQAVMWLYSPSSTPGTASAFGTSAAGTYTQLGLTSVPSGTTLGFVNPTTGGLFGNIAQLADNGQAVGTSNRYDASGNFEGQSAWYFNGKTNVDMSPAGPYNVAAAGGGTYSTNSVTTLNGNGFAAGYATRLSGTATGSTPLGQDAYVFDALANGGAGKTFLVDTPDADSANYTESYVGAISKAGEAVGVYDTFHGTTATLANLTGQYLFLWNESDAGSSPTTLVSYPTSSLISFSTMESFASSFEFAPDGSLYGPNTYSGATSVVRYSVVPAVQGQSYSSTPLTVYTPSSGTLTLGLNSTSNTNQDVVNRDGSLLAGYTVTGSLRQIYYFSPTAPFPDTASLVSLTDSGHLQSASTPSLIEVSSSGEVLATQTRLGSNGSTQLGTDVFTASGGGSPTIIPLPTTVLGSSPGAYYYTNTTVNQPEYTMGESADSLSVSQFASEEIGTGGTVAGTVTRYAGDAEAGVGFLGATTPLGSDGFYYSPTTGTSTAIGLYGGAYSYSITATNSAYGLPASYVVESNNVIGMAGANAAGYASRYTSTGTQTGNDGWIYTPSNNTTTQIGLVGGNFTFTSGSVVYENTQVARTNALGEIAGKSYIVTSTSYNAANALLWLYSPSSTPGTASGFGISAAGTYTQLGLTSAPSGTTVGYQNPTNGYVYGNIVKLADNGHAVGISNRYDSSGNYQGGAAWYFNGRSNIDMSPSGPYDLYASGGGTYSTNTITALNNYGYAAGYATRLAGTTTGSTALGQDAYVFDANANGGAGKTFLVDAPDANSANYALSYVGGVSSTGEAVGVYSTYTGTTTSTISGQYLFVWNESMAGSSPQILSTNNGQPIPTTVAFSTLESFASSFTFGPDGTLYGPNTYTNATSVVEYSVVPEPACVGLFGFASLGLLGRHRRRTKPSDVSRHNPMPATD